MLNQWKWGHLGTSITCVRDGSTDILKRKQALYLFMHRVHLIEQVVEFVREVLQLISQIGIRLFYSRKN